MPANLTFGEDDGYLTLKIGDVERAEKIDLFRVNNEMAALILEAGENPVEQLEALSEYVRALGFPKPSHKLTAAVRDGIFEKVETIKAQAKPGGKQFSLLQMSRFYGFWLGHFSPAELLQAQAAMPGLLDAELLRTNGYQAYDSATLYEMVLRSTGDEELAKQARTKREIEEAEERGAKERAEKGS